MSAQRRISRSKAFERAKANDVLDALAWGHETLRWRQDIANLRSMLNRTEGQRFSERGQKLIRHYIAEEEERGTPPERAAAETSAGASGPGGAEPA